MWGPPPRGGAEPLQGGRGMKRKKKKERLDTVDRFLMGLPHKRKAGDEASPNMFPNQLPSKPKTRKYGEAYLPFGFTCTSAKVGLPCKISFPASGAALGSPNHGQTVSHILDF